MLCIVPLHCDTHSTAASTAATSATIIITAVTATTTAATTVIILNLRQNAADCTLPVLLLLPPHCYDDGD